MPEAARRASGLAGPQGEATEHRGISKYPMISMQYRRFGLNPRAVASV